MDTLADFLGEPKRVGEGDCEMELDSSMKIVDEGELNLFDVAVDEACRREVDRDPESAALWHLLKNWTNRSLSRTKRINYIFA